MSTETRDPRDQKETEDHAKPVTITLNEQSVTLEKRRVTGLEIKQAAIAQGVRIGLDFVLTAELPGDKSHIVRDDELITVKTKSEFTAVTPDDNS